ncbi:hypothetical protein EVAR_22612_1 [Eumeta japonica]|uniref:Uncharacterized protein n=1 Tax=Eumeta variegata TaxID=151549 RepID=A0A4C1U8V7_EUMVA|nr:hypothetical protein EVAR_22612_1 [Eumeta japonica]
MTPKTPGSAASLLCSVYLKPRLRVASTLCTQNPDSIYPELRLCLPSVPGLCAQGFGSACQVSRLNVFKVPALCA